MAQKDGRGPRKQDVVEAEVQDGSEGLAESDSSAADADDGSSNDIVPVVN